MAVALFSAISASATTCVPLGTYTLASPCNPASFKIYGDGPTNQSVGTTQGLITGTSFNVGFDNNSSTKDVLIIGVFSDDAVKGTLNGISFTPVTKDPFDANHNGAISSTFSGLGFPTSPLAYGWLDLGKGVASGQRLTVDMLGIPDGTIFYAEAVDPFSVVLSTQTVCDKRNSKGKCIQSHTVNTTGTKLEVDNINANSEAGVVKYQTPEPSTLVLLGSALLGFAFRRRK